MPLKSPPPVAAARDANAPAADSPKLATRAFTPADVAALAALHRVAFPHAAVSQLGRATAERYYESILANANESLLLGTFDDNRLAAFVIAGVWDEPEKQFLRRNLQFVATRLLLQPWLLFQPFIRERIRGGVSMLFHRGASKPPAARDAVAAPAPVRSLEILYLGVDPADRGQGLARQLLKRVEAFAHEHDFAQLDLSVYLDNTAAIELYLSEGWQKRLSGTTWKGFMRKPLRSPPS